MTTPSTKTLKARLAEAERLAAFRLQSATEDFRRCCDYAIRLDLAAMTIWHQAAKITALQAKVRSRRNAK